MKERDQQGADITSQAEGLIQDTVTLVTLNDMKSAEFQLGFLRTGLKFFFSGIATMRSVIG